MIIKLVKKGYQNKKYISMVAVSEERDFHWRNEKNQSASGINIMFKHTEICKIVENLIACEPIDKREQFIQMLMKSIRAGKAREGVNELLFLRDGNQ